MQRLCLEEKSMNVRLGVTGLLAALAVAAGANFAVAAGDDISLDRAKVLYGDGNYKDALTTLTRLQEVKVTAAGEVDRFALFMLKAEAQIKLGDASMALTSLGMAHKEALRPEQKMQAS